MDIMALGGLCFGVVVGWITYRSLRRREGAAGLADISTVIAAVGGGAVTALFEGELFGWYAVGLAIGFFAYLIFALMLDGKEAVSVWMGDKPTDGPRP